MIISKYGIQLISLKEEDIELVRVKRNSENIRNTMNYKEIITPEQQKIWFEKLNNAIYRGEKTSFYFVIHFQGSKIGLINGKDIDNDSKTSEGGFFIWEEKYLGTLLPVMVSIITLDFSFLINDFISNQIKVIKSNTKALNFNKLLGYEVVSEDSDFFYLTLSKDKYLKKSEGYRKIIGNETGDFSLLNLSNFSFDDTPDEELKRIFPFLPEFQKDLVEKVLKINKRIIT